MKHPIKISKSDSGVAPAIAVVLIVMLTCITAGIFAIGITNSSNVPDFKIVGATISQYTNGSGYLQERGVEVTLIDSGSHAEISELRVTIEGVRVYYQTDGNTAVSNPKYNTRYKFYISGYDNEQLNNVLVSVIVKYQSGSEYTVLTKRMSFAETERENLVDIEQYSGRKNKYGIETPGHGVILKFINPEEMKKYDPDTLKVIGSYTKSDGKKSEYVNFIFDSRSDGSTYTEVLRDNLGYYYYIPISTSESDKGFEYRHISLDPRDLDTVWNIKVYASPKTGKQILDINGDLNSGKAMIADKTLEIAARVGYNKSEKYSGYMTLEGLDKNTINVSINPIIKVESAEYIITDSSGNIIIQKSYDSQVNIYNKGYNQVRWGGALDLEKYNDDDKFEVYLYVTDVLTANQKESYTNMWYYFGSKTIGDLKKDYTI